MFSFYKRSSLVAEEIIRQRGFAGQMAKPLVIAEYMAESVGFEPTRHVNAYTISSRAPSAARTTLRVET